MFELRLTANTSPGTLLWIISPEDISAILQVEHWGTAKVYTKVTLKLLELPKNLGFPSPEILNNINPFGLLFAATCKGNISRDWTCIGVKFWIVE